jgi:serpin B
MLILMPAAGSLDQFESNLTADVLQKTIDGLSTAEVRLSMPRFKIESSFDLGSTLTQLGMDAAFDPQKANFSAMDGSHDLSISSVVHKAYVNVDEEGTEAAAATGVIVGVTSMPMQEIVELNLDHPFVFFIMDNLNGAVLFMGRVANP